MSDTNSVVSALSAAYNRFSLQSVIIKTASALVAGLVTSGVATAGTQADAKIASLAVAVAVLVAFVIWLTDGYYHHMQNQCLERLKKAAKGNDVDFDLERPNKVEVTAIWSVPVVTFHGLIIIGLGLLAFIVK